MLNVCVEIMSGGPPHRALQHHAVIGHLRSGLKPGCFPLGVAGGTGLDIPVLTTGVKTFRTLQVSFTNHTKQI